VIYRKNMRSLEQSARILFGCLIAICGWMLFGQRAMGWVLIASGVMTAATGVFGYCPACALGGRRPSEAS